MKEIYVVTDGEYSDYGIKAIFSSPKEAKEFVLTYGGRVEPWEMDGNSPYNGNPRGLAHWRVDMNAEGEYIASNRGVPINGFCEDFFFWKSDADRHYPRGVLMSLDILAKDERHAVKIANDKRARLIADNLWGKDPEEHK